MLVDVERDTVKVEGQLEKVLQVKGCPCLGMPVLHERNPWVRQEPLRAFHDGRAKKQ